MSIRVGVFDPECRLDSVSSKNKYLMSLQASTLPLASHGAAMWNGCTGITFHVQNQTALRRTYSKSDADAAQTRQARSGDENHRVLTWAYFTQ
jgi:hypothetical protein